MVTEKDVVQFFIMKGLDNEDPITNLKLQKLLYYAKGFHQAIFDNPLFQEKLQARTHGTAPITELEYNPSEKFDDEQLELLNEVWSIFGQFSAWKLRDMSCNEKPWLDHEKDASVIEDEELGSYFKTRLYGSR